MHIIRQLPPLQTGGEVAFDIEMFNLPDGKLHHPEYGEFACMTLTFDGENVYYIDHTEDIQEVFHRIKDCLWIFHNGSFDITHLRRWAYIPGGVVMRGQTHRPIWDTYLMERVLWSGYFNLFGLQHLVRRYLDIRMDKETRDYFKDAKEMTPEMINYACLDPIYTFRIKKCQEKVMKSRGKKYFKDIWVDTDELAFWAYRDIQPARVDRDGWIEFGKQNQKEFDERISKLDFNPRSPDQVKTYLQEHGWKNIPSTGKKVIRKWVQQYPDHPNSVWIKNVQQIRSIGTRTSTYGEEWAEKNLVQAEDGNWYVRSSWDINKASTGRTTSGEPNLMNIPIRETPQFRKFFIARPGHKLVISDWSQQEPRISAWYCKDPNLIKIFEDGGDAYVNTARIKWGNKITKSSPERNVVKAIFLGIGYGLTSRGLADNLGIGDQEAEEFMDSFWEIFPVWYEYLEHLSRTKKFSTSVLGRRLWLNEHSWKSKNNAKNNPIQSTAAEMKKRAFGRMWEQWKFNAPFGVILDVHDEIDSDVPEGIAEEVAKFSNKIMVDVAEELCPGIPFVVDTHICKNWAEAKE